ncbi:MAG: hypothetical protein H6Q69_3351 [Firmicutes bacterium]|nr:hypothetical protein [Bacillota bacterium]
MKTTVHANPAKVSVLWSVVKLIHVINRNAKRLETGGYTGRENKEVIFICWNINIPSSIMLEMTKSPPSANGGLAT